MSTLRDERYDECVYSLPITVTYSRRICGDEPGIEHRVSLCGPIAGKVYRHVERQGESPEWTEAKVMELFEAAAVGIAQLLGGEA